MKVRITLMCLMLTLGALVQQAWGQNITVTGTVRNKSGEALPGATVSVLGGASLGASDSKGGYSVTVAKGATLIFTFSGMAPQRVVVKKAGVVDVVLEEGANAAMNEVVVVGYGAKKRRDLSTAVSSVSAKEITATPVADAAQALQGRVSGVTITQNSGAPGGTGGTAIRIRGISSLTGTNNPLIVVDGYPLPDQGADNILNSFGTGDIESIDVLKDAAAASIYGVRASNGVIMITTKRGKPGKATLTVDMYAGLQEAWRLPKSLNAREYAIANSEARIASGLQVIPKLADFNGIEQQYGKGTDWLDEIFRRAAMRSVNITATGGSDKASYLFSAGYFLQDGIVYKTDVERFNLRFNGDVRVNDRIKIGNSLSMNKLTEHGADTYNPFNSVVLLAMTAPPTVSPRNADGTYAGGNGSTDGFNEPNPIYQLEVPKNRFTKYRITGNIFTEIGLYKGLKFKALFGGDFNFQEVNNFSPATPSSGGRPFILTGYSTQKGLYPDYLAEYTLTYDKIFGSKHKVNAVAGYTFQENKYSYVLAGRGGNFTQNIPVLNDQIFRPTDISQTYNASEDGVNSRLMSYFGRVNYDFDNRGFFGVSIRRDGSSNFAPANKFAVFPSVSAAWRLSQEPFLKNVKWLDELKVRGSFGYTGNPNVGGNAFVQGINQSFQYTFGNSSGSGGVVGGAAPSRSYNPDIRWEKNEQLDIGFDGSLFKNRMGFSIDFYQRRSKDLILYVAPPFVSGTYESVPFNTGTLQNRGIDLSLNGRILSTKDVSWNANAVVSLYRNEVISMGLAAPIDNGFSRITGGSLRTQQGSPAGFFYGFVTDGIFQSYAEIANHAVQTAGTDPATSTAPGDIRFKDLNNDGVINDQDRTNIGNANPNFTFGLTNTVTYKNLEINLFIQGSQGNKVLNFTRWYTEGGVSNGNYSNKVIERWTAPGTSNTMPRLVLNDPNGNNRVSDRFVEDASYVRIKNLRVAYNMPAKWSNYLKLKKAQLYASVQNLATFTNYTGLDPEVGGGVDIGFYPQSRTILAGVLVDF
jgi:TonB-dependent starch-binding outer membrane protein SusC